jgi:diguanylate cyclase (GGDEF)-like protein/PAS domain S-box-containing protein
VPYRPPWRSLFVRYGLGLLSSAPALAIWVASGRQGAPSGFLLFLFAVSVSAWYGGFGPGLLTSALGTLASVVVFDPSLLSVHKLHVVLGLQLVVYIGVASSIAWINGMLRRTRQALQRQLDLTNAITSHIGEGIYAVDKRGRLVFINRIATAMLGWDAEELRGRDIHQLIHRCRESLHNCPLVDILRIGNTVRDDDDSLVCKDGSVLPVSYTSSPMMEQGEITGAVMAFRNMTDLREALRSLRASEEWYRSLVETSPECIWLTDIYGYVIMVNQRAASLYGYGNSEEMLGIMGTEVISAADRMRSLQDTRELESSDSVLHAEYISQRKDGTVFPSEMSMSLSTDDRGKVRAVIHVVRDVTERKLADETLRSSEARLAMQYATTTVLAQSSTLNEAILSLIQTVCEISGWDMGAFWSVDPKTKVLRCRNVSHLQSVEVQSFKKSTLQLVVTRGTGFLGEVWAKKEAIWMSDVQKGDDYQRSEVLAKEGLHSGFAFPVIIDDEVHSIMEFYSFEVRQPNPDLIHATVVIGTEVGQFIERKQVEEALEYQAMHDSLTDLPNRVLLKDRLQQAIRSAERHQHEFALLLMDLNHFKEVNDTFGHQYGDLLLQEVGTRIRATLRDADSVARLGGDEFAILLPAVDSAGAQLAAAKIVAALDVPFELEGHQMVVGASVGIAIYPTHGENSNVLLSRADIAMYVAKRNRAGFATYTAEQDQHSPSRMALKSELRHAIESGQLVLHYQAKSDLATGTVAGAEVLVRWQHPVHGLIMPDAFISLTEQSGLMSILTMSVLSTALRQCRSWKRSGFDMNVAINLSAGSLQDDQLVGMVAGMLRAFAVPADQLTLEVTESAVMTDPEQALELLLRLHSLGIRIAIDDFGTGYSSLAYVSRLPADELKIDKSFVMNMATDEGDHFIVRSVIELGHNLGMKVVAEGVESERLQALLTGMGCDLGQGAHLGMPIPVEQFTERFVDVRPARLTIVS